MIKAAFLAGFDTRSGWKLLSQWPEKQEVDLAGLEMTVLPSGSHSVDEDVIFFVRECSNGSAEGRMAGIAAFINTADESSDRGAKLTSLGLLLNEGTNPWDWVETVSSNVEHLSSLEGKNLDDSLRLLLDERNDKRVNMGRVLQVNSHETERSDIRASLDNPVHPLHIMHRLVFSLGPKIWTLWRAVLLGQKILIVTPNPLRDTCRHTWNIARLASLVKPSSTVSLPLGAVGLHDIDRLKGYRAGWIACTTDRILLESDDLYDLVWDMSDSPDQGSKSLMANKTTLPFLNSKKKARHNAHLHVAASGGGSDRAYTQLILKMIGPLIDAENGFKSSSGGFSNFFTTALNLIMGGWWGWWLWQKPTSPRHAPGPITIENHDPAWTSLPEDRRSIDLQDQEDTSLLQDDTGSDLLDLDVATDIREIEMNLIGLIDERTCNLLRGLQQWVDEESKGSDPVISSDLLERIGLSANTYDAYFVIALLQHRFDLDVSKFRVSLDWIDVILDWFSKMV